MLDRGPSTGAILRIVTVVVGAVLLLYGAYRVRYILVLMLVALFLAVGLDPLVHGMQRIRLTRPQAVLIVFLGATLFIVGFLASVTPPLVRQTQTLAQVIPEYADDLANRSERFNELDARYNITNRLRTWVDDAPDVVGRSAETALGVARGIGRLVFSVVTVTILTIYFLLDLPMLIDGAKRLLPLSRRRRFEEVTDVFFGRISGYLIGQLTVSAIAGASSFVVLTALRVPFSIPLAMWVAFSALIPMVGATLGAIPAVLVAFFTSIPLGIITLVFFLIYQQVENYVVHPRVMRRAVEISPAAVILAALIGASLLGFVGALLAIPLAASIKVIVREVWIPRQEAA